MHDIKKKSGGYDILSQIINEVAVAAAELVCVAGRQYGSSTETVETLTPHRIITHSPIKDE